MSPMMTLLMNDLLISRRQEQAFKRQQEANVAAEQRRSALEFERGQAGKLLEAQRAIPQGISSAKSPSDLPTDPDIVNLMNAAGQDTAPVLGRTPYDTPTDGTLPSADFGPVRPPELEGLVNQRDARREMLIGEDMATNLTKQDWYSEKDNRMHQQWVPTRQAAAFQSLPQGPTPEQAGANYITTQQAGQLNPAYVEAKSRADNEFSRLTRGAKQADARAQSMGTQSALHDPANTSARLNEFEQQQEIQARYRPPTEFQQRGQMNLNMLLAADSEASKMERAGMRIPTMALNTAQSPFLTGINQWVGVIPDDVLQYVGVGIDYGNTYGFLRSGITMREDEFPRYVTNLFALEGDSDAIVRAKQGRRAVFHAATMATMSGQKAEAGAMLARAIRDGSLPGDVMNALSLDPEVQEGFKQALATGGR